MFLRLVFLLLVLNNAVYASSCDSNDFKRLLFVLKQGSVDNSEFAAAQAIAFRLNDAKCHNYEIKYNGGVPVVVELTQLFGEICRLSNTPQSVTAYVEYIERNSGSAEEQLSISFESMFRNNPSMVLTTITNNGQKLPYDLLEKLAWGFLNNSYHEIDTRNYRDVFFRLHPDISILYQKYTKHIDLIFEMVEIQLKRINGEQKK